ncbi:MAG TPA: DUF2130 domain-containing protein [Bacteroidota bacterium]|nr:DUF2130 domain-containing protein [Bacteroidota bacterium]
MAAPTITCPKCGHVIELTEAFTHQVEEKLRVEYNKRFFAQREELEKKIRKETEERLALELKDLRLQNEEKERKLREAQEQELQLRKRQRELEDREHQLQLELQRKLDEERKRIWNDAAAKIAEEHRLKDAEKDRQISDMLKQIEELKRRAEQGSQQAQGETLEIELENLLRTTFRTDEILPVPKGVRGADVIQHVRTPLGNFCGTILWESKRTKNWSDAWIQKLKDDQREVKANLAVIVSTALPKEIKHVGNIDGVWVTDFAAVEGLALALRSGLVEVARTRASIQGKGEKMELVYNYLAGQEFRQRIEALVESYVTMKEDLDAEKRAMEKLWAKREQQLQRGVKSLAGLYGDLQGIIGSALQPVTKLELPSGNLELFDE